MKLSIHLSQGVRALPFNKCEFLRLQLDLKFVVTVNNKKPTYFDAKMGVDNYQFIQFVCLMSSTG